jgi:two-component system, chemotaxis family, CheB/CheR fusion protein
MDPNTAEPRGGNTPSRPSGLVVGLGASAGGIEALQAFFSHVAPDSGAAYVVILHLSPERESHLAEVLQTVTAMPVVQVHETSPFEPDHVYVISPKTSLRMTDGLLTVTPMERPEERRAPVDIFFRALAEAHGSRAVGIVLSGTGADGSSGIRRLKEYGGLTIAQDPAEASRDDMPRSAVAGGLVDYVLPVREMPARLRAYADQAGRDWPPDAADEFAERLREIVAILRRRTGHDFSQYKRGTLLRRIDRRRHVHALPDLAAYAQVLRERQDESAALLKDLLISVTNFFRDGEAFAALESEVVPRLFAGGASHVRAWVAGCATGEEAYSIAMLLAEAAGERPDPPIVQVFASDLDAAAVAVAREGFYTDVELVDVSPVRLRRFFHQVSGGYRVRRELRELILFAQHNVLTDPPFSHLDLICCRNLLIYLDRSAQERLLDTFHFALRPGRYLFLGASESATDNADLFIAIDKGARIFESRAAAGRPFAVAGAGPPPLAGPPVRLAGDPPPERISPADLHLQLLEEYAPPSLVVTEDHHVVHVSRRAARLLRVGAGEPTRDALRMIHPDLRVDLRTALIQAARARTPVRTASLPHPPGTGEGRVAIEVRPVLRAGDPARGYFVVLFEDEASAAGDDTSTGPSARLDGHDAVGHLEEELHRIKGQLRATVEQYETQVEEGRASNEELQAVNEELRSSAEELETSKEELQSVNEELTTVNQELKVKVDELAARTNDFQNLINSTEIGTVFLDRQLRVKFASPSVRSVFNLLPLDTGRKLSDITTDLVHDGLYEDIGRVLQSLQPFEREVPSKGGLWYLLRILPYRTFEDRIEGVVLTFQDITLRRRAELDVRESEERLRLLIDSVRDYAIFTIDPDGVIASWNAGAQRMFSYDSGEAIGQAFGILFTPEDRAAGVPAQELAVARAQGRADDERWHVRKDGSRIYCSGVTTPLGDTDAGGFAKIARDLTVSREAQRHLEDAHRDLDERVSLRTRELEAQMSERRAAEQRATELVRKLVATQEDERARMARDLHDQVGQQITALRLSLERLQEYCRPDER